MTFSLIPLTTQQGPLYLRELVLNHASETDTGRVYSVRYPKVNFVGMMTYDGDTGLPAHFLIAPPSINHVSGQYLCGSGVTTFAVSETQKFGHVTFFWNGNRSGYINDKLETYFEVRNSPRTVTQMIVNSAACQGGDFNAMMLVTV